MKSNTPSNRAGTWFLKALILMLAVGTTALFLLGMTIYSMLGLSGEARLVRDVWLQSASDQWQKQIEVGVGPCFVLLARAGLSFVDLDAEVRAAISSVQSAQVGVYRRDNDTGQPRTESVFVEADKAMLKRGWDRIVSVVNSDANVTVYGRGAQQTLKLCVVVESERDLVVVSASGNIKPLFELAMRHARNGQCTGEIFELVALESGGQDR